MLQLGDNEELKSGTGAAAVSTASALLLTIQGVTAYHNAFRLQDDSRVNAC